MGPRQGRKPTDRTREAASALVWSRVTGSEYTVAPIFQPPNLPPDRQLTAASPQMVLLRHWEQRKRYMSYPELLEALEALAIQIVL
ncbi:hypothetical protein GCM10010392_66320 [Streptomyces clavifer]|nr:hypothetical protein GCM10010392_66320 [Streptomyces clavifer]